MIIFIKKKNQHIGINLFYGKKKKKMICCHKFYFMVKNNKLPQMLFCWKIIYFCYKIKFYN